MFHLSFNKIKSFFKLKFKTLAEKLILIFILILVIAGIILILSIINFFSTYLKTVFINQNESAIQYFIKTIIPSIKRYDYWSVETNCRELLLHNKNISFIYIYDINGYIINNTISILDNFELNFNIIDKNISIVDENGEKLGLLRVGFNYYYINLQIFKFEIFLFLILFIFLTLFVFFIYFLINKVIGKPLFDLGQYIQKIGSTDFREKIKFESNVEELSFIYNSFELMRQKIEEKLTIINNIIDNFPYPIIMINSFYNIQRVNKEFCKLFNIDYDNINNSIINNEELYNRTIFDISDYFIYFKEDIEKVLINGENISKKNVKISGGEFKDKYHTIDIFPLKFSHIIGAIFLIQDTTKEVNNLNTIGRVQKLESLGVLASGIAHDFNNILAGIKGSLSLIEFDMQNMKNLPESLVENFNLIKVSTDRATNVINQLFLFTRKYSIEKSIFDIDRSIKNLIKLCKNSFSKEVNIIYQNNVNIDKIDLIFEGYNNLDINEIEKIKNKVKEIFLKQGLIIKGVQDRIEQSLLNIMINGYHAMTIMKKEYENKGGILSIKLELVPKCFLCKLKCNLVKKNIGNESFEDEFIEKSHFDLLQYERNEFRDITPDLENNLVFSSKLIDFNIQEGVDLEKECRKVLFFYKISIIDQGVGIDSDIINKIFDPFFTTKERSVSSGIGLSMVYNIIKDHFGFIDVYSVKYKGTKFVIYLPVYFVDFELDYYEFESEELKSSDSSKIEIETKDENNIEIEEKRKKEKDYENVKEMIKNRIKKVLIVDDEENLRVILRKYFKRFEIEIFEANDGRKGEEIFIKHGEELNLLIIDYIMPEENGYNFYMNIKDKLNFEKTKIIFTSGLFLDEKLLSLIDNKNIFLVSKPFSLEQIEKLIFEIFKKDF